MIEIREMSEAHLKQVAQLEKQCFSDPWPLEGLLPELTNPLSLWLVAMDGPRVAGYIGSQSVCGEADMMNVAVSPEDRRRGIGRMLIQALMEALRERQVHSLSLEVRASNAPALALYDALGFTQVGRRPHYYRLPREDALILRKEWQI